MAKMEAARLLAGLDHFTGSENYTRHGLMRNLLMTDGVMFLQENAEAFWLVDVIASHLMTSAKLRGEEFQTWRFEKNGVDHAVPNKPHRAYATDGNTDDPIVSQDIEYSDFPLSEIKFFCVKAPEFGERAWVLMLPSEY
jgi:hypothetical protein